MELQTSSQAEWVPRRFLGDVQIRATAPTGSTIFIGIARTVDVDAYLNGVSHATVTQIVAGRDPVYSEVLGGAPAQPPGRPVHLGRAGLGARHGRIALDAAVR